jgi:hypothetical protein
LFSKPEWILGSLFICVKGFDYDLIKAGNDSGGREAINRLIKAYNFSSRQQLCDHLSVSKSTMANRYLRDSFPAEWVIQCALETGISLYGWPLVRGKCMQVTARKKISKGNSSHSKTTF